MPSEGMLYERIQTAVIRICSLENYMHATRTFKGGMTLQEEVSLRRFLRVQQYFLDN